MSFSLPNPGSPATNDPLTSLAIRQNFQALAAFNNAIDGTGLISGSVQEAALATGINDRLFRTLAGINFVVSGFVITSVGSGFTFTLPAGIAYINGFYVSYGGGSVTVAANQDSYIDMNSSGGITVVGVGNNATTGMALTSNNLRLAKIVSNGSAIVQFLQNSINVAPVAPNTATWFGYDPLGNPVAPPELVPQTKVSNGSKFLAYPTTTQTLTGTGATKIVLQGETYDSGNNFDNVTNYRYTVTVPGFYLFQAAIDFVPAANGTMNAAMYKNGSPIFSEDARNDSAGVNTFTVTLAPPALPMLVGDYSELVVRAQEPPWEVVTRPIRFTSVATW